LAIIEASTRREKELTCHNEQNEGGLREEEPLIAGGAPNLMVKSGLADHNTWKNPEAN